MKRFSIILFGALAILMASCSKHAQPEPEFEPWVNDLSLPVPIQFGTTGFEGTKAAPVDVVDNLAGRELGVFGINRDEASDWTLSANRLLTNEKATYDNGLIKFENTRYYPPKSELNYTFYGYYVRSESTSTTPGDNDPQPTVEADAYYFPVQFGNTDYLWAKSKANKYEGLDGFNAKYIRKIYTMGVSDQYMPKFNFKHVTAGVQIWAKGDDDGITDGGAGEQDKDEYYADIQVCSVVVVNAVTSANLCIAHKTAAANEGKFFSVSPMLSDIKMKSPASDGSEVEDLRNGTIPCSPTVNGQRLGYDLFLYPGVPYNIDVYYTTAASGNLEKYTINTVTLAAGTQYKYTLIFHRTRAIEISVTLQAWTMNDQGEFDTDPA